MFDNDEIIDGVNETVKAVNDDLYNLTPESFIIFDIDGWRDLFELSVEQERYIEFIRKYGSILSNEINSEQDILDKFSDDSLINLMNDKNKTSDIMQQYVLFNETYGPILSDWISNIDEIDNYFDQKGPNSKLMDILLTDLFDYVFSDNLTLKNNYIEDERLKKYIDFRNKYNKLFSNQNNIVYTGIKYENINSILNDFDENGITNNFINKLIKYGDKKIFDYIFQNEEWRNFISDTNYKKIEQFFVLKEKYDIYLYDINEIDDYLRDFKPGDKLYESSLYNFNVFNSLDIGEIKKHFENNPKIVTYVDFISKYGYISFIKNLEDIEKYFTVDNLSDDLKDKLFKEESDRFLKINWEEYGDLKTAQYIKYINKNILKFNHYISTYYDIQRYFDEKGPKKILYYHRLKGRGINLNEINYMTLEDFDIIPEMEQFLFFLDKYNYYILEFIDNIEDIKLYFCEDGPKPELYERALFDFQLFKVLFLDEGWKNNYKITLEIEQYIEYVKKYEFIFYNSIKKIEDIPKCFDDKGIKQSFVNELFIEGKWDLLNDDLIVLSKTQSKSVYFYKKMSTQFRDKFKNIILNFFPNLKEEYVEAIAKIFIRCEYSNSTEIQHLGPVIISQIYQNVDTPDELIIKLNKIEEIFLDNKIPYVAKAFKVFEMLNPNLNTFDFNENSTISPNLKRYSNKHKMFILFGDLLKCTLKSNNRSMKEYLKEIRLGNEIYVSIRDNGIKISDLNDEQKYILGCYIEKLKMLYTFTEEGKNNENIIFSGDMTSDIEVLCKLFNSNDLPDRIIRMFGFFAGVSSLNDLEIYIEHIRLHTDFKNHNKVNSNNLEMLEYGDLVKGIGDIRYLGNILQNGSVAREFLGDSAGSDMTPLDTDLSMVINKSHESIRDKIVGTDAYGYGPIYLVLKNNDRFNITRTHNENIEYSKLDLSKYELFYTGALGKGHYGIRTGFPSSEIDYIVVGSYDSRVGLEIVMNGFYIPVVDMNGNLVFSPNDYDLLRNKMSGLSYYEKDIFNFSADLDSPEYMLDDDKVPSVDEIVDQLQANNDDISSKREYINDLIRRIIAEGPEKINEFKTRISRNILSGSVEFLDTGSTGRGTNVPNDADFDFVMRIDREILLDNERRNKFVSHIVNELGFDSNCIQNGNIRKGKIKLPNSDVELEIDITFVSKTNKLEYSTEMCVEDRMTNIKKQSPESYPYVLANIIYAKKFLKAHNVYKPGRADFTQGGMGGVGVENWILQNGGSFKEAARSFMEVANTCETFEEFKCKYHVFDFGSNHMAESRSQYPHDDFVWNMNQIGYDKMKQSLSNYLAYINTISLENESIQKK